VPLDITFQNTTQPHGTPISYSWRLCALCPFLPATGSDTTITFSTANVYEISLRATNACGSLTASQDVYVYNLVPSISYTPSISCVGQPISFSGSATIQPDPPPDPPF